MQYALDSVQYEKNIARLLQCKLNGDLFRYIIKQNILSQIFDVIQSDVAIYSYVRLNFSVFGEHVLNQSTMYQLTESKLKSYKLTSYFFLFFLILILTYKPYIFYDTYER